MTKDRGSNLLRGRGLELLCLDGPDWPDTLNADEVARLWHPDDSKARAGIEAAIARAIERGEIPIAGSRQSRAGISVYELGIGTTFPTPGRKPEPACTRAGLAAWLGEDEPPELVRAWLGDAWPVTAAPSPRKEEPQADTRKKWEIEGTWEHQARAIGQAWMLAEEQGTGERPGVEAIARYLEGELSNLGITGRRGRFLDWETVKREALTGITERKAKGRK